DPEEGLADEELVALLQLRLLRCLAVHDDAFAGRVHDEEPALVAKDPQVVGFHPVVGEMDVGLGRAPDGENLAAFEGKLVARTFSPDDDDDVTHAATLDLASPPFNVGASNCSEARRGMTFRASGGLPTPGERC